MDSLNGKMNLLIKRSSFFEQRSGAVWYKHLRLYCPAAGMLFPAVGGVFELVLFC